MTTSASRKPFGRRHPNLFAAAVACGITALRAGLDVWLHGFTRLPAAGIAVAAFGTFVLYRSSLWCFTHGYVVKEGGRRGARLLWGVIAAVLVALGVLLYGWMAVFLYGSPWVR